MNNKEKYVEFCKKVYVPIYSKEWWLDAVCGSESWDVWIYEKGGDVIAAMPYYKQNRGSYKYITKAPLTQNNGIIFKYPDGAKRIAKQEFEEDVINKACEFINELQLDVYEQQYHYNFRNWLPFYWNNYTAITRYTYVLEALDDLENIWKGISAKYRNTIKKGMRNGIFHEGMAPDKFYSEHEKIFRKQGLDCPFSFQLWERLYSACVSNDSAKIIYATDKANNIASLSFLVWDERSMYLLLGGSIPEYRNLETYNALIWKSIEMASKKGLKYDFEGSVIKRISKSFREFGGEAKPYFRIRKVFNPEIIRHEAEELVKVCEVNK